MIVHSKKTSKKKTYIFSLFVFIVLAILFVLAAIPVVNPGIWQFLSIIHFVFSTHLLVKFYLSEYIYTLSDSEFFIDKKTGGKTARVCHIDTSMIVALYTKEEWKEHKKSRQITSVYNYNSSFMPAEFYSLVFEMNSKKTAVLFECSEEQGRAILKIIRDREENQ